MNRSSKVLCGLKVKRAIRKCQSNYASLFAVSQSSGKRVLKESDETFLRAKRCIYFVFLLTLPLTCFSVWFCTRLTVFTFTDFAATRSNPVDSEQWWRTNLGARDYARVNEYRGGNPMCRYLMPKSIAYWVPRKTGHTFSGALKRLISGYCGVSYNFIQFAEDPSNWLLFPFNFRHSTAVPNGTHMIVTTRKPLDTVVSSFYYSAKCSEIRDRRQLGESRTTETWYLQEASGYYHVDVASFQRNASGFNVSLQSHFGSLSLCEFYSALMDEGLDHIGFFYELLFLRRFHHIVATVRGYEFAKAHSQTTAVIRFEDLVQSLESFMAAMDDVLDALNVVDTAANRRLLRAHKCSHVFIERERGYLRRRLRAESFHYKHGSLQHGFAQIKTKHSTSKFGKRKEQVEIEDRRKRHIEAFLSAMPLVCSELKRQTLELGYEWTQPQC